MYWIPMLMIIRSWDRLVFNMGIHILVRRHLVRRPPGRRQAPDGPHVGPMNLAIWAHTLSDRIVDTSWKRCIAKSPKAISHQQQSESNSHTYFNTHIVWFVVSIHFLLFDVSYGEWCRRIGYSPLCGCTLNIGNQDLCSTEQKCCTVSTQGNWQPIQRPPQYRKYILISKLDTHLHRLEKFSGYGFRWSKWSTWQNMMV